MESVKITSIEHLTHDVLRIVADKPDSLHFRPGQATEISINKEGWKDERRPFTFTSLPEDGHIEFTIKTYPAHNGVTNQLLSLEKGDELIIHDVFGAIAYKNEGIFIAGGAGVTPFIAILKQLAKENKIGDNKLIFANKTADDIILEEEFNKLLGDNFINVLSDEKTEEYEFGYISKELIADNIDENTKYFYICGPEPMMEAMEKHLTNLGISKERIIKEEF